ncbi:MAG: hypothetical protein WEE50_10050 [Chloroflexota bacterium]
MMPGQWPAEPLDPEASMGETTGMDRAVPFSSWYIGGVAPAV